MPQPIARTPLDPAVVLYDPAGQPVSSLPRDVSIFDGRVPGSGRPLAPYIPQGGEPRAWVPFAGYNLNIQPRSEFKALTPFQTLRALADNHDVTRICIEDVKAELQGMTPDVRAREGVSQSQELAINDLRERLRSPDGEHDWVTWLTMLLEDQLVIDAVSIYRQRTNAGDPYALLLENGETIKPIVDFRGRPPVPPEIAYQQIVYGRVETEFTRPWKDAELRAPDGQPKIEMVYAPRHKRTHTPYGQSPVERIILTINLALRRQLHFLTFYTHGTMPDAFWKVPKEWTGGQIIAYQEEFDAILAGESQQRAKLRFMPGGEGTGLDDPRGHDAWAYDFDEWMGRVVAWCFETSPLPIVKMMNRATSEQADAGESDSGTKPRMKWLSSLMTREFKEFYGYADVEFFFRDEKPEDERLKLDKRVGDYTAGIITRDEARTMAGLKPATPEQKTEMDGPERRPLPQIGAPGGEPGGEPDLKQGPAPGDGLPLTRAGREDLRRWKKAALRDVQTGRRRRFETTSVPAEIRMALTEWLGHATVDEDVHWAFRSFIRARRPLRAARKRIKLERGLRSVVAAHFKERAAGVAVLVLRHYEEPVKERTAGDGQPPDDEIDKALDWEVLAGKIESRLADAFAEGVTLAEQQIPGEGESFGLLDEAATAYAENRAAELVGMRRLEDGTLVPNPSARWSVPQTVRDRIHATVKTAVEEGWTGKQLAAELEGPAIWDARADAIARTEVAAAVNRGAAETYNAAGVETVTILDGPGCLEDGHDDAERGVSGETWTIEKFMEFPVGHPNCRRDAAPNVEAAQGAVQ